MAKLYVETEENTPRYVCDNCHHCTSNIGTSLCKIKNRGCCWYFPKFELYDIQRMSQSIAGLDTLKRILNDGNAVIHNYYIQTKGYYEKDSYENYIKSIDGCLDPRDDKTIYFRACPFVKENVGCTIPSYFRNIVCNFFICDEIWIMTRDDLSTSYINERDRYSRWVNRENLSLQNLLRENNIHLNTCWDDAIALLQTTPINTYEFPNMPAININTNLLKEAQ